VGRLPRVLVMLLLTREILTAGTQEACVSIWRVRMVSRFSRGLRRRAYPWPTTLTANVFLYTRDPICSCTTLERRLDVPRFPRRIARASPHDCGRLFSFNSLKSLGISVKQLLRRAAIRIPSVGIRRSSSIVSRSISRKREERIVQDVVTIISDCLPSHHIRLCSPAKTRNCA
jgi:hypothetical protein